MSGLGCKAKGTHLLGHPPMGSGFINSQQFTVDLYTGQRPRVSFGAEVQERVRNPPLGLLGASNISVLAPVVSWIFYWFGAFWVDPRAWVHTPLL